MQDVCVWWPYSSHPRLSSIIFVVCVCVSALSCHSLIFKWIRSNQCWFKSDNEMVKWGPKHHYSWLNLVSLVFPSDNCSPQALTVSLCAGSWRTTHVWLRVRGLMLPQEIKPNTTSLQLLFMHAAFKLIPSQSTHRSRHICLLVDLPCALELTGDKPSVLPNMRKPWSAWIGIHFETIARVIWSSHRKAEETHRFRHSSAHDSQIRSLWLYCIVKKRRKKKWMRFVIMLQSCPSRFFQMQTVRRYPLHCLSPERGNLIWSRYCSSNWEVLVRCATVWAFEKCLFYNVLIVFLIDISCSRRNSWSWMHWRVCDFGETGPLRKQHHKFRSSGISAASYFTQFVI